MHFLVFLFLHAQSLKVDTRNSDIISSNYDTQTNAHNNR